MKLQELNLKSKPQTKYFDGGFISFQTTNHVLSYTITKVDPHKHSSISGGEVQSKEQLENLLNVKSLTEAIYA